MKNLILVMVLKMWMAFVGATLTDDVEVYLVDEEAYEELYDEMDYQAFLDYEKYFDVDEESGFALEGIEYENGDVYYSLGFINDDFTFGAAFNDNYELVYYSISWN